jgi:hypothetical protein
MWSVIRYFHAPKDLSEKLMSLHRAYDEACAWARYYSRREYGCALELESPLVSGRVFGPEDPRRSWVFVVRYSPVVVGGPPGTDDEDEEEDQDEQAEEDEGEGGMVAKALTFGSVSDNQMCRASSDD